MADVPALRRAAAILRHLAGSNRPLTAGTIARAQNIPRSSVYDLLGALEDLGFVIKVGSGYLLGSGVAELGSAYLRSNPLGRLAQPHVRALAEANSGTAHLAVLRGWETVYVLKEQAQKSVAVITASGVHMPAYLTATGRAIMSGLTKREVLALFAGESTFVNRTGTGPRSVRELNMELAHARTRGYAIEKGEITPGIWTVAVPVVDALERPIASVGLSLPEAEHSGEREAQAAGACQRTAAVIGKQIARA